MQGGMAKGRTKLRGEGRRRGRPIDNRREFDRGQLCLMRTATGVHQGCASREGRAGVGWGGGGGGAHV